MSTKLGAIQAEFAEGALVVAKDQHMALGAVLELISVGLNSMLFQHRGNNLRHDAQRIASQALAGFILNNLIDQTVNTKSVCT